MRLRLSLWLPYSVIALLLIGVYLFVSKDNQLDKEVIQELEQRINELQEKLDAFKNAAADNKYESPVNPKFINQIRKKESSNNGKQAALNGVDVKNLVLPVLVMACDRVTVSKPLDSLLKHNPDTKRFPIIVSQDCGHVPTAEVISNYPSVTHIKHTDDTPMPAEALAKKQSIGYYKISRHYQWALSQVFDQMGYDAVIVVEDDLEISADFFEYFLATYPLLKQDRTLYCVSAWNDNGNSEFIDPNHPEKLYRTDFFPGLGWMLTKDVFKEIHDRWPPAWWDDWIRMPEQRRDRACIRPEISRTSNFGRSGVSKGQFFDTHLKFIHHSTANVHFTQLDLSYLLKDNYDTAMDSELSAAPLITWDQLRKRQLGDNSAVRVEYSNSSKFQMMARSLKLMDDFKSGVARTAYRGVVTFMLSGVRVYLVPSNNWTGYSS